MINRERVERDINERWHGICGECGNKARQYLKIDNGLWVSYNICDCGRMFNFTRKYLSALQEFDYKITRMRDLILGIPHLKKLQPL